MAADPGVKFILADTETTGPTPQDRVCEVAWVELDPYLQVLKRVHSLIDPEMHIGAGASGVHGITDADVEDAPTMDEFFEHIVQHPFAECRVVLIAHNVQFDKRYLAPYMPKLAAELCTLRLARRVFPEAENHKLATLMYHLNLPRGESHRADGDVDTTLGLLRLIAEKTGQNLAEMAALSMEPVLVEKMPFGKHRDVPVRMVPRSYVEWLRKQGNLDMDLAYTFDKYFPQ